MSLIQNYASFPLGGAVGYSTDLSASDRPRSEMATYVNIPVSPTSKKQLHYMELELQEPSPGIRGKPLTAVTANNKGCKLHARGGEDI